MIGGEWDEYFSIVNEIKVYIRLTGSPYPAWYVGITDDADRRLFIEHKVDKDTA